MKKIDISMLGVHVWEHGEFIVTVKGRPVGRTVSKQEGQYIIDWLPSAWNEIVAALDLTAINGEWEKVPGENAIRVLPIDKPRKLIAMEEYVDYLEWQRNQLNTEDWTLTFPQWLQMEKYENKKRP